MLISSQNPYLFKFGAKKLAAKESRYTAMAEICGTFREFNHLRLIKEGFERIYDCKDRVSAIQNYEEWTKLVPPSSKKKKEKWEEEYNLDSSLFEDIQTFANTMRKLNTEIFNFFDPGMDYTNAVAEGVNCFVERVNRQGNGYGYKRLRAKALFYGQVAQPPKYRFDHRKEPIFEESSCSSDAYAFTIGFLSFDSFRNKKIIGYEEYYDLECEESQNWQQPWTVFDLLP
jgi:hypothetical protein